MKDTLFGEVTEATGLPKELISEELGQLISAAGVDRSEMTLDDLRRILADYVQDILLAAKDEHST
jgi:hypothetical protein